MLQQLMLGVTLMALKSKVGLELLKSEIPAEQFILESLLSEKDYCRVPVLQVCEGFSLCFFFFLFFNFGNAMFRPLFCKGMKGDKWRLLLYRVSGVSCCQFSLSWDILYIYIGVTFAQIVETYMLLLEISFPAPVLFFPLMEMPSFICFA